MRVYISYNRPIAKILLGVRDFLGGFLRPYTNKSREQNTERSIDKFVPAISFQNTTLMLKFTDSQMRFTDGLPRKEKKTAWLTY